MLSLVEHDPQNIRALASTEKTRMRFQCVQSHSADRPSRLPSGLSGMSVTAAPADPGSIAQALGLRNDAPRAIVRAIVSAADSAGPSDPVAVEKALSAFNLAPLLEPGATVSSLAKGIAGLAQRGAWGQLAPASK